MKLSIATIWPDTSAFACTPPSEAPIATIGWVIIVGTTERLEVMFLWREIYS